jgi:hypothetical protein
MSKPSVRMVFQTHEHNIKVDFGIEDEAGIEQPAEGSEKRTYDR